MAAESTETIAQETSAASTETTPTTPPTPPLTDKPMWEDEPVEQVKDDAKPEEPAEAPTEKPASKDRDYGKEMQRMAQRQAALEKKLEQTFEDRLKASEDRILKALESKLPQKSETKTETPPAESPATALKEKLKSIRSQSLAEPELLDVLEPMVEQLLEDSGKRFSQADVEKLTQKAVEAELLRREALTGEQQAKEAAKRREFDEGRNAFKEHLAEQFPDRAAEIDSAMTEHEARFNRLYRGLNLSPETAKEKSDLIWNEVWSSKSPARKAPKNDPKDTIGATTVPSGGSATRATVSQKKDIPLWIPD